MSKTETNVLKDGELVVATLPMSGDVIEDGGIVDATSVIQTTDGPQKVVKTYSVGGGGGGGATWGSITGTLSNQTDLQTALNSKQSTTNIVTLTTESTEIANNTIYNGGELASVTLTAPANIPADFIAQVEFTSGATATTFTAPASLYFNGDACEGGIFTPIDNKRYCALIITDGVNLLGFVVEK